MNTIFKHIIILSILLSYTPTQAEEPDESAEKHVNIIAQVTTESLEEHEIKDNITGFGSVLSSSDAVLNVSFPRPVQVIKVFVTLGQAVKKGEKLLEIATDPSAQLTYRQTFLATKAAKADLRRAADLFAKQLATNAQLAAAKKALSDTEEAYLAQKTIGSGQGDEVLESSFDGIVTTLTASQGDRLQAGAAALQVVRQDGLRASLGIDPQDVAKVRSGMSVKLVSVFDDKLSALGSVTAVTGMVNPQTQMVDVLVNLESNPFLAGTKLQGSITVKSFTALAVPRSALLADDKGTYVFVAKNGQAKRQAVKSLVEEDGFVAIESPLMRGARIVTVGNYILEDGMHIRERELGHAHDEKEEKEESAR